ncbi:papilin [Caerostris darwini]|uniref:Papilin n=1 Tax=Caerostris darwini TaxID=1538125 RepID=A0AAV4WP00_9ARAC|nr:papilin [Caerostris darwini]
MKVIIGFVLLAVAFAHQEQCPENQHFDSCGSACPLTCDNYENLIIPCVPMCVPGCLCDEGFVKKEDGTCVAPENCPNRCPENQHFTRCGTDCPLTCENYLDPPQICNLMCVSGCECDPGYLKRRDGACVLPVDCLLWGDPDVKNCVDKPDSGMCMALFFKFHYDQNTDHVISLFTVVVVATETITIQKESVFNIAKENFQPKKSIAMLIQTPVPAGLL